MATEKESPYICHVFVCTNDRQGARRSCADNQSAAIRAALKEAVDENSWRPYVRVSQSGCLGLCDYGPNVILYPQKIWFSNVTPADVPAILKRIEGILEAVES